MVLGLGGFGSYSRVGYRIVLLQEVPNWEGGLESLEILKDMTNLIFN